MSNLENTDTKCHVCNGDGYQLITHDFEIEGRKCRACHGTGLSNYGRALENFQKVGICKKCDRPMVHYRLRGYKCPYCDDKD